MAYKNKKKLEFFALVSIPTLERAERGLPETLLQMSEHLGVFYRTITKWHREAKLMGISRLDSSKETFESVPLTAEDKEWKIFMRQLTIDAAEKGATAPTRTLYAQLKHKMPRTGLDVKIGLSADERLRRMLDAEVELEEFKQLQAAQ